GLGVWLWSAGRLVRAAEYIRELAELVAEIADEDGDRLALLRDRDHERLGMLRDAVCGAGTRGGLLGCDRGVRHELHIRVDDLLCRLVENDPAVHLGQLVNEL